MSGAAATTHLPGMTGIFEALKDAKEAAEETAEQAQRIARRTGRISVPPPNGNGAKKR